jgi:uncharacterized membrane protein YhaH (DUF805 family)
MIRDLFLARGEISRQRYLSTGLILFALKYALDYLLTTAVFRHPWQWFPYLDPLGEIRGLQALKAEGRYALAMVALALPFIWIGTAMTTRRIRATGLPRWLVILFFLPIANLVTLGILCLVPDRKSPPSRLSPPQLGLAASLGIVVALSTALVWFSTGVLRGYGTGLFIALPFCLGFLSVSVYNARDRKSMGASMGVAALSVMLPGVALLAFRMEGAICLLMALPLALPLAFIGGAIAKSVQDGAAAGHGNVAIMILVLLYPPAVMCAEYAAAQQPPLLAVRTAVEIDAPPEAVWRHVVSFSDLPAPAEWIFHTGIAYPVRARIEGHGPGAVRRCEFSTGPFVEPIEIWNEPALLRFSVSENPAPMEEWTPYGRIHPEHLDNFLVSRRGQFELTALPAGRTRLEGTTWYTHNLWPGAYWQRWSDYIIHRIHLRVLSHIKDRAETARVH